MPALLVAFALLVAAAHPIESWTGARTIIVRGSVSAAGSTQPVVGAQISVVVDSGPIAVGTTTTGSDGSYLLRLAVPDDAKSIVVRARALGYAPAAQSASVADTVIANLAMVSSPTALAEVVVTGGLVDARRLRTSSKSVAIAGGVVTVPGSIRPSRDAWNTEEYTKIEDNRFVSVASSPLSTFSVDVDRASYTNVRRFISQGALPPKDAVRIEEMINYFTYGYPEPRRGHPVSITTDVSVAPWNEKHRVVRIGLQTQRIRTQDLPPSNLVFLIDVSGSMTPAEKLPLVKQAFRLLVNELREQDRVAIVVYAGNAGLVLPSTSAADKERILDAIEQLEAGGSTAGGAGIRLAYDVARQNHMPEGNNRVIWATDGDFNVGVSSTSELVRFVEERRAEGTALTVLGFGMGNLKDGRLEQLADKGNGNYAYVDGLMEARKVFVQEMGATLLTVAKDVKLQVEFNPAAVQAYRLIGYENRLLRNEDFADDTKDAGEIGAGHAVTALYEIVPVGVKSDVAIGETAPLRYQDGPRPARGSHSGELLFVNVRYKSPSSSTSRLMQHAVHDAREAVSSDFRFALAVAGYGMLLRNSEFKGKITYDDVLTIARGSAGEDRDRQGFVDLVEATKRLATGVARR